ncbi:uncharacterized protein LOC109790740 [Cajanus cajan]|uniref:Uncharacterized protein n=1 Tax=Cajanus cajan TaxID=3821 RepID=A0A151R1S5_CAJCA|nr:uncharacterized protein LOC109790740 [Cajanus cajan]KYP36473.1 hypothetical protein KK1_042391 [Cajanus cajan]
MKQQKLKVRKMAYRWRGRCPSEEYQVYDPPVEAKHHRHRQDNKGRVAFRTNYEDPIAEEVEVETNLEDREQEQQRFQSTRFNRNHNAYKSVDQEAEAFILYEHSRMEMARLMSIRDA